MARTVVVIPTKKRRRDHGSGTKKYGRHKSHCLKYKMEGRREKNKKRKIAKHLKMVAKKKLKKQ
jgi:hypothetical protein